MDNVIEIKNLYKEYNLGNIGRGTLYRDIQSFIAKIRGVEDPNSLIGFSKKNDELMEKKFLALKGINLEIKKGEIIGVIGSNGAGKSTLLKILSRITSPTLGEIKIKGKVASLLEVGTGFHPELTGRENIYLNGSINGMTKKNIDKIIHKIIDFTGIKDHIDTPIKRYSSGMEVRLGFAVAAFFDCDIMICDEVLAVGDYIFQDKAISKMKEVSTSSDKTVLFVSHNMESIKKLCTRVIILSQGQVVDQGDTLSMVKKYSNLESSLKKYKKIEWPDIANAPGGDIVKLKSIKTMDSNNNIKYNFNIDEDVIIEIDYWVLKDNQKVCVNLYFSSNDKSIFQTFDNYIKNDWKKQKGVKKGVYTARCIVKKNNFNEGIIDLNLAIFLPPGDIDTSYQVMLPKKATGILSFNIIDNFELNSVRGSYPFAWHKDLVFRPQCEWKSIKVD